MQKLWKRLFLREYAPIRIVVLILAAACLVSLFAQKTFAKHTYVITDGDQVFVHTTYFTDPDKVLTEAGIVLSPDDFYTTGSEDGKNGITVQRAKEITILYCGEEQKAAGYEESVEQLLHRLGIPSQGEYRVNVALSANVFDGMTVVVDRVLENTEQYTVELPFETIYVKDPTLPEGEQKVLSAGKNGLVSRKAQVVYCNAQEQSRNILEEIMLQQPVNQVVAVGTGTQVGQERVMPLIGDGVIVTAEGEVLYFTHAQKFVATAYTKTDAGCDDITATGTQVRVGVVAVDPKLIPYGTRMFIITDDGEYIYGIATAEDCGGSIKGNRLDLYFDTDPECWEFGIRDATAYFLGHVGVGYYK